MPPMKETLLLEIDFFLFEQYSHDVQQRNEVV